ncbi:MAG: VOC family virulence protein [Gammaproteobacteria bacterium]|nr:VOC family virulence protein [Gammaproteobacteria bacterium]MDD9895467.1 VOC family virulence protein [Gammaproteobacteria bacterium]MDD9957516.1 VOC family virulence protein [Gammaproteobacteria bacterium]
MITSFDHVSVPMERVEEMMAFYTALGCRVVEQGRIQAVTFGNNKINFHMPSLWQDEQFTLRGHTAVPGSGDICFVWDGSQEDLLSVLEAANAEVELGPVPRVGGMNGGSTEGTSIYTRDPDNNLIEFIMY